MTLWADRRPTLSAYGCSGYAARDGQILNSGGHRGWCGVGQRCSGRS